MRTVVAALCLGFLTACAPFTERQTDATVTELLERTRAIIPTIADASDRIDGMLDFALALHESGNEMAARDYLDQALELSKSIQPISRRSTMQLQILGTAYEVDYRTLLIAALPELSASIGAAENPDWTQHQMLAVLVAKAGNIESAQQWANKIPEDSFNNQALRAKALTEISAALAATGELSKAERILDTVTSGLPYYRAIAYAALAEASQRAGHGESAEKFFERAINVAHAQTDNYFVAGSSRIIADSYVAIGSVEKAKPLYQYALAAAAKSNSPQESSRALSRIISSLADVQLRGELNSAPLQAVAIADSESRDVFRFWAYYELAGSLAQIGMNELSLELAHKIPADLVFSGRNLRSATMRDVAWGFAQNRELERALVVADAIAQPREQAQALSRIARVVGNPSMKSLSRYL